VINEATILEQGFVVGMGEDANFRIGEDQSAQQIVFQITLKRDSQRFFDQRAPCFACEPV